MKTEQFSGVVFDEGSAHESERGGEAIAASGFLLSDLIFSGWPNGLKFLDLGRKPCLDM